MLPKERHRTILETIRKNNIIKISEIIAMFNVSAETVRRDLEELESLNKLKRIYGGAVSISSTSIEPIYSARAGLNQQEKVAMGKKASELINDGDTIILDIGTTVLEVAKNLKNKNNVTVLTSSLPILNELVDSNLSIYVLGGHLRTREFSMSGPITNFSVNQFFVDKAIIGVGGVTFSEGISDYNLEEAQVRKISVERAKKTIVVADNSKFGINAFAMVCPIEAVDIVVTDWNTNADTIRALRERNIEVVIAEKEG